MAPSLKSQTRNLDVFKTAVTAGLLIIIAIVFLLQGRTAPQEEAPPEARQPVPTVAMPAINPPILGEGGSISLSGSGQPGATIELWAGDTRLGDVPVGEDGTWSWQGRLEPGDYQLRARTVDGSGQTLNETAAFAYKVPEPEVEVALPTINMPALGEGGSISLSGSGQPGATIELWLDDTKLADVLVGEDGTWSWEGRLEPGDYQLSARTVDESGQTLNETAALAYKVPEPVVEVALPAINPPILAEGGRLSLSGSGQPGATIELWLGDTKLGDVPVGEDGTWAWEGRLEPGDYQLSARTLDGSGQVLNETLSEAFTVEAEAVRVVPILAQPQVDAQGTITLTGTAEPGTTIEIVEDGAVVGSALVGDDGTWVFAYQAAPGAHRLAARNEAEPEVTSAVAEVEVPVPIAATEPAGPPEAGEGQDYIVRPGDSLSALAQRFYGDAQLWRLIFEATNARAAEDPSFNTIENPSAISPGWKLWIPAPEG